MVNVLHLDPPLVLEGRYLTTQRFATFAELDEWLTKEVQAWAPLNNIQLAQTYQNWRSELLDPLTRLRSTADQIRQQLQFQTDVNPQLSNNLRNGFQAIVTMQTCLSGSMVGQEVLARAVAGDPMGAIFHWRSTVRGSQFFLLSTEGFNGLQVPLDAKSTFREFLDQSAYDPEKDGVLGGRAAFLDSIIARFQVRFDDLQEQHNERLNLLIERNANLEEKIGELNNYQQDLVTRQARSADAFRRWLTEVRKSHKETKQLFTRDMELSAPSLYWRSRATRTLWAAGGAFASFLVGAIAIFLVGLTFLERVRLFALGPDGRIQIGAVLLLSPLLILPIWLFRMIAKVFTTTLAESVDAAQRRVMVTTFLALTKDKNSHLSEAERFIILQALFRSSSAKDDDEQVPSSLMEALVKGVQGTSK